MYDLKKKQINKVLRMTEKKTTELCPDLNRQVLLYLSLSQFIPFPIIPFILTKSQNWRCLSLTDWLAESRWVYCVVLAFIKKL